MGSKVELKMELSSKQGVNFLSPLNQTEDEELVYRIDDNQHKIIYLASPKDNNLRFEGGIYDIQFEYESKLENLMGRIEARYRNEYEFIPKDKIFGAKQSLWRPMNFTHTTSDLSVHNFDRDNSIKSLDYVQLLTIDYNLLIA
jgi:hypothetical protein